VTVALPGPEVGTAWQRPDGAVVLRAATEAGLERLRFVLALDADHTEFLRRFAADPLLGPSTRALQGLRPLRTATVAHALLRAIAGQLVESRRARALERAILRAVAEDPPSAGALGRLAPAELCRLGLPAQGAAALVRLCRTLDPERLHDVPTAAVRVRLERERGVGPWSSGVVTLQGLGRFDHGLVGDLGLIKLYSSLSGRWVEPAETADLLAPYGEWQGLAGVYLLAGWKRGLVPGATADAWRPARARAGRAA
jgi:3-methyladenine DNA glycosylase/8-oxoguanine DNA glycosylase